MHYAHFVRYSASELNSFQGNWALDPYILSTLDKLGMLSYKDAACSFMVKTSAQEPFTTSNGTIPITPTLPTGPGQDKLSICYLNTRSMVKHQLEIFYLLDTNKPDMLLLSETWLTTDSSPDILAAIPDTYYILQTNRSENKVGGGLLL